MVKNSTISKITANSKKEPDSGNGNEKLNIDLKDIQKILEDKQIQAPQKSVDFILNFSKAYKTVKLNNGDHTEMIIN